MTKKSDYEKVQKTIRGTQFIGLSVVSIDVDVLLNALDYATKLGTGLGLDS